MFALKNFRPLHYFLGFEVTKNQVGLLLCQSKYTKDILVKANMQDSKPCNTPFATDTKLYPEDVEKLEHPLYKSLIGALHYLTLTRPDISF